MANQSHFFDSVVQGFQDDEFRKQLPEWLQVKIAQIITQNQSVSIENKKTQVQEKSAFQLSNSLENADTLAAWQQMTEAILNAVNAGVSRISHEVQFVSDHTSPAIAYTHVGKSDIVWNIPAIINELRDFDTILRGHRVGNDWVDASGKTIASPSIVAILVQLLDTTTHEDAHIRRGESEGISTHTPEFYAYQRRLLNSLINPEKIFDIYKLLEDIQRTYKPLSPVFTLPFNMVSDSINLIGERETKTTIPLGESFSAKVQKITRDYLDQLDLFEVEQSIRRDRYDVAKELRIMMFSAIRDGKSKDSIVLDIQTDEDLTKLMLRLRDSGSGFYRLDNIVKIIALAYPEDNSVRHEAVNRIIAKIFDRIYPEVIDMFKTTQGLRDTGLLPETISVLESIEDPLVRISSASNIDQIMQKIIDQIMKREFENQNEFEQVLQANRSLYWNAQIPKWIEDAFNEIDVRRFRTNITEVIETLLKKHIDLEKQQAMSEVSTYLEKQ